MVINPIKRLQERQEFALVAAAIQKRLKLPAIGSILEAMLFLLRIL